MPYPTGNPGRVIGIVGRREEAPVRLLTWQLLLFGRWDDAVPISLCLGLGLGLVVVVVVVVVVVSAALLLRFRFSPVVRLALLAVVDEEGEGCG